MDKNYKQEYYNKYMELMPKLLEFEPERIKIGDFKYKHSGKMSKWGIRPKVQPKVAHVKNKKIVFDALTKDLLSTF